MARLQSDRNVADSIRAFLEPLPSEASPTPDIRAVKVMLRLDGEPGIAAEELRQTTGMGIIEFAEVIHSLRAAGLVEVDASPAEDVMLSAEGRALIEG